MSIYNHQKQKSIELVFREVVFGMEDGMVSTLGAVTGIAIGSFDLFLILLSGVVIIAVESISMAIGTYLSSKSEDDLNRQKIKEEKHEIKDYPLEEKYELLEMFMRDGWPKVMADQMVEYASSKKELFLKEMQYRELGILVSRGGSPRKKAMFMFFSYVIGGMIPLSAYFVFSISRAMPLSILVTLFGLFGLGVYTSSFTKKHWLQSGIRVLILGGIALAVGLFIGKISKNVQF